jgi:D-glycero-alpha-D-manno-heptose 1-phosphate guanylyltransferase
MTTNEAIVLAGGMGSRLKVVLPEIPKCMAPVNGKPFLTFVLDYLANQGISKVILSVGYRKEQIISFFGNKYGSLSIEYAIENEPMGTGGAVKLALDFCQLENVLVLNGDTYFNTDLAEMENMHFKLSADVTIAVKHMPDTGRYGSVKVGPNGRILSFNEKDPSLGSGLINGGIYLLNRKINNNFSLQKFSLENDFFKALTSKLNFYVFQSDGFFIDMGIPEDYVKAQALTIAPWKL